MRFLTPLLFCVVAAAAQGSTLVVSPEGDDAQSGSREQPLKTISAAARLAQPGDVVLVLEGTYRERVTPARGGQPGRPITYRGEPGKRVFIKGSEVWTPDWKDEGGGVYSSRPDPSLFDDRSPEYVDHYNPLKVKLASTPWGRNGLPEAERKEAGDERIGRCDRRVAYTCGQVFVSDKRYKEVPLKEELAPECWWYDAENETVSIHFGGLDPAGQVVELTTRRRLFAPERRGLSHIVVEGFIFEHCGNQYPTNFWEVDAYAQKGAVGTEAGSHWTIRNNVVRHAKTFAIDAGNVDRHSSSSGVQDNVIERNYVVDNGSAGILSNGSVRLVIRDNVVARNNQLRFDGIKRWEQAGVKCHNFSNGLITRNYIASNYNMAGVWLDNKFPECRVSKNFLYANGRAGVFFEMSDYGFDSALVDNNIILENQENAVYIHDASGVTFVHNLLANTGAAEGHGQAVYLRQVSARTKTYHHTFFANLFIGNKRDVEVNYPAARSGEQRFNSNVYSVPPSEEGFVVNAASDVPSPWDDEEFGELIRTALDADGPSPAPNERGKAPLTLPEWKRFWRSHGVDNDTRSRVEKLSRVEYDPETHQLTLEIKGDCLVAGSPAPGPVASDYLGDPLPDHGAVVAGPLQSIRAGTNRIQAWRGLPLVSEGKLPAAEWTAD